MNIAHRDMKPENILFVERGNRIKLIDFGMSKICKEKFALMNTKLGTPYYVPPEILEGTYDKRCDLWSVGVITFILLCGEPPFFGDSTPAVFRKIRTCDYDFTQEVWNSTSKHAQDFIEKLLQPNLKRRMTVE